jgi:hypothetical protein
MCIAASVVPPVNDESIALAFCFCLVHVRSEDHVSKRAIPCVDDQLLNAASGAQEMQSAGMRRRVGRNDLARDHQTMSTLAECFRNASSLASRSFCKPFATENCLIVAVS